MKNEKKYKRLYICFSSLYLIVILILSILISKRILDQNSIIIQKQNKLSYILELNDQIEKNSLNLKELEKKEQQISKLNDVENVLISKQNELQNSINKYNKLNSELEYKIKYYE